MNSRYLQGKFVKPIGPACFEFLFCDGEKRIIFIIPSHVEKIHFGYDYLMFMLYREEGEDTFYQIIRTIPCEWTNDNYLTKFKGFPKSIHPFKEDYTEFLHVHEQIRHWARFKNPSKYAVTLCNENKPFNLHEVNLQDVSKDEWIKLNLLTLLKNRMIFAMATDLPADAFRDLRSASAQDVFVEMIHSGELGYETDENGQVISVAFKWLKKLQIESPMLLDDVMITGNKQDAIPLPDMTDFCSYVQGRAQLVTYLNTIGQNLNVLFVTNLETDVHPDVFYTRADQKGVRMIPMKCVDDLSPEIRKNQIVSVCIEGVEEDTIDVWYAENGSFASCRNRASTKIAKQLIYKHFEFAHCLKPSGLLKDVGYGYNAIVCLSDCQMTKRRAFYVEQKQRGYRKGVRTPIIVMKAPLYFPKEER